MSIEKDVLQLATSSLRKQLPEAEGLLQERVQELCDALYRSLVQNEVSKDSEPFGVPLTNLSG
jgi:hypothetical protein